MNLLANPKVKTFFRTPTFSLIVIYILLLLPAISVAVINYPRETFLKVSVQILVSLFVFTIPLVLFFNRFWLYFILLSIWVLVSPLLIFFVLWLKVPLNFSLVALILQTNVAEVKEAVNGYEWVFVTCTMLYTGAFFLAVKQRPLNAISFRLAFTLSIVSFILFSGYAATRKYRDYYKVIDILEESYPLSILSGIYTAHSFAKKNNLEASKDFHFNAFTKDSIKDRKIYVFIIGESSRYDRWSINGYSRPTSPRLAAQKNVISFANVTAGCNVTWMSVPQMITRANPDNIDLQFKEKSILAAYKDAGFKTVWLSNQGDKELFWSGTITLHAKTADVPIFNFQTTINGNGVKPFDLAMVTEMDSIIKSDKRNVFFVLHTLGNHWIYSDRYPDSFDVFKPSGKSETLNPFVSSRKQALSNSYDNSILYADFVMDSLIRTLQKYNTVSTVFYQSDHGDDIFDADPNKMNFHLFPSVTTLHVPLFIWTSDKYKTAYPTRMRSLQMHKLSKIGAENTFFTLLDLADISFAGFDSTKSFVNPSFRESNQKFYNNDEKKADLYSRLN